MEIEGGYLAVTATVELLKIATLVHVVARADCSDPKLRDAFPIAMTAVERYPALSLARDPLVDMGKQIAEQFFDQVKGVVRTKLSAPPAPNVPSPTGIVHS